MKTFKKWPFSKYFDCVLDDDGRIEEIKCIPCSQKLQPSPKKRQLHGSVLGNVKQNKYDVYTINIYYYSSCLLQRGN